MGGKEHHSPRGLAGKPKWKTKVIFARNIYPSPNPRANKNIIRTISKFTGSLLTFFGCDFSVKGSCAVCVVKEFRQVCDILGFANGSYCKKNVLQ